MFEVVYSCHTGSDKASGLRSARDRTAAHDARREAELIEILLSPKQREFIGATADEVLFGGAAGGGKSWAQLYDAFLYALRYPGSKQLILRRTFPELDKSLIRVSLEIYPREVYTYNSSRHLGMFANGSLIDFGYCDSENDVFKYQSAEYDVIRFDELTHFTEQMYTYLISRVRGANGFPKQVKSSTNPGGVGHQFVKARFVDIGAPNTEHGTGTGGRIFIPSKVQDNQFLLRADPDYLKRLENLAEKDKKALLYGDWDIFDGQYFSEFSREIHVCEPFEIPAHWRWYFTMDYGFDMAAFYWIAVDEQNNAYVAQEFCQGKDNGGEPLIIQDAARAVKERTTCAPSAYLAPPDLWNSRQETGKSAADIFAEHGIYLTKTSNDRVAGWMAVKEWLKPFCDVDGVTRARLRIFSNCTELIKTLPALQYDDKRPSDVATQPHGITHSPDALRGFCVYWVNGAKMPERRGVYTPDLLEDWQSGDAQIRKIMEERYGKPY